MIIQILMSGVLLFLVPAVVGTLFEKVNIGPKKPLFYWISGQMLLWAAFQLISVPMILKQCKFSQLQKVYSLFLLVLSAFAIVIEIAFFDDSNTTSPASSLLQPTAASANTALNSEIIFFIFIRF